MAAGLALPAAAQMPAPEAAALPQAEPFFGPHQGGIATAQQKHSYFAAFDVTAKARAHLVALLRTWTEAAARMAAGQDADGGAGDTLGLPPARLTLTFGFGPGLFARDGQDRFGLAALRPAALADLPRFNGDQLDPARSGGDISVQACADDPQVAFHAVRELGRIGYGAVQLRWAQTGFMPNAAAGQTPRNLMGFKDGTDNPRPGAGPLPNVPRGFDAIVWAGDEGPGWMRGGSYVVARRIRIALEHWDRTDTDYQEQVVGRHKRSGAPLGQTEEFAPLDLDAADADGNPVLPESSHVRLGSAAANGGAQMFRRGYSYNDGAVFTAERWPPWRQGMLYDAGLFFVAYQRDPCEGFVRVFESMAKLDAMNQFTTHVGSGLFACPPGVAMGGYVGQGLFEAGA